MPYILQENRPKFDRVLDSLDMSEFGWESVESLIVHMITEYSASQGGNYAAYNRTMGMILCCTMELGRRTGVEPTDADRDMFSGSADSSTSTLTEIVMMVSKLPLADMVAGDMNYCITRLMHSLILLYEGQTRLFIIDDVLLTMSNIINDFYLDVIAPYEDTKIEANGPVSEIG